MNTLRMSVRLSLRDSAPVNFYLKKANYDRWPSAAAMLVPFGGAHKLLRSTLCVGVQVRFYSNTKRPNFFSKLIFTESALAALRLCVKSKA